MLRKGPHPSPMRPREAKQLASGSRSSWVPDLATLLSSSLRSPPEGALLGSCHPGPLARSWGSTTPIDHPFSGQEKKQTTREGGQAGRERLLLKEVIMHKWKSAPVCLVIQHCRVPGGCAAPAAFHRQAMRQHVHQWLPLCHHPAVLAGRGQLVTGRPLQAEELPWEGPGLPGCSGLAPNQALSHRP